MISRVWSASGVDSPRVGDLNKADLFVDEMVFRKSSPRGEPRSKGDCTQSSLFQSLIQMIAKSRARLVPLAAMMTRSSFVRP